MHLDSINASNYNYTLRMTMRISREAANSARGFLQSKPATCARWAALGAAIGLLQLASGCNQEEDSESTQVAVAAAASAVPAGPAGPAASVPAAAAPSAGVPASQAPAASAPIADAPTTVGMPDPLPIQPTGVRCTASSTV